ncbi:MAG: hypothetical protein E7225_04600 [Clostridiales bacterium]|nr:hypothetical protein [Clostridiales bacterium]
MENRLYDLYCDLMKRRDGGNEIWEEIRDKKLTAAPAFEGDLYEHSKSRLMVVGRAVNGWEVDFPVFNNAEEATSAIIGQSFDFSDVVNPKGLPYPDEPSRKNYFYSKSKFWKLIKFILELYGDSDKNGMSTWYTDNLHWNRRIIWSNLYKIAPRKGGNPDWSFFIPDMQYYIDIIKTEIKQYRPDRILFVTDWNYFSPENCESTFANEFLLEKSCNENSCVVASGKYGEISVVVCKRPDRSYSIKNIDIINMAKEIHDYFEKQR